MKIDHVAAYVSDLEKAREFFCKYFSCTANERYHNPNTGLSTYFLSFDDGARLELMHRPDVVQTVDGLAIGFTHLAFSVGSKEAVDSLTAHLKEDGYQVVSGPRTTGDGYYESCVAAVDGLLVEITV